MADSNKVFEATDSNFEQEVLKSDQLTLVDFWAEWCGPCRQLAPTIEGIAQELDGKIKVFKMNVDDNPGTPSKYGIRGIPTVILFKDGEVVEQLVGNQPRDAFTDVISKHS